MEQRRGTIRSGRRPSSAVDGKSTMMDRSCALILMYGIYFCYVLACFGAVSAVAGLMLGITSEQPKAHDKGKIIAGVGIGICAICFIIAFYCRSVRLDEQIMESIKEEWTVNAGWWNLRYGTAAESRTIPVRPASSVVVYYQTKAAENT